MKRLLIFIMFVFTSMLFSTASIFPIDFGLLHNQKAELSSDEFLYTPDFTPWISWNNKQGISLYFSALFTLNFTTYDDPSVEDERPVLTPELSHFALTYRFGTGRSLEAGRIPYNDLLGIAAIGLFDGVRINWDDLSGVLFYTGLLYKEAARIIISAEDADKYAEPWNFDNFNNYFASSRIIAAFRYTYPLMEGSRLVGELLCQFDLNNSTETFHSQYGSVLLDLFLTDKLRITAGAVIEAMQRTDAGFNIAFGGSAQVQTALFPSLNDLIGLTVKFSTGQSEDDIAFTPINTVSQGEVFPGAIGGLALISLDYEVRILPTLYGKGALRYFMRTYVDETSKGSLYGAEFCTSAVWQPLDDVRANIALKAFFPGLGDIDIYGSDVIWRISAGLSIAF